MSSTPQNLGSTVKCPAEYPDDHNAPIRVLTRIYVCIGALKQGLKASGRELLGLDRDLISGPFPDQVLTVVGIYANSFQAAMKELKDTSISAHAWLSHIPPEHWARSQFSGRAHSDVLLNNICEAFNGKIVQGSDEPIITTLEFIRDCCMKRIVNVLKVIDKCPGPLTPIASSIMAKMRQDAIASQNGASVVIVQTGQSIFHSSVSKSVQGGEFGGPSQSQVGATHSGNGGGYQPWGSYTGSPTMETPASPKWSRSFIRNESLRAEVFGSQ
ncbi:hypothetical protein Tco_1253760 [Tanacetum coccineum]